MSRSAVPLSVALVMFIVSVGLFGQDPSAPIQLPDWKGQPILTDGVFSTGEWDDALKIQVRPDLQLLLKKSADFVFIGLRYSPFTLSVVDLFISPDGQAVHHLHVSAQLGERRLAGLSAAGDDEEFVWGDTHDWYANEIRWDAGKVQALTKAGQTAGDAQLAALFHYDGFEFQIRRSKFASDEWLVRFESPMPPDWSAPVVFPVGTNRQTVRGWLKLVLK